MIIKTWNDIQKENIQKCVSIFSLAKLKSLL